MQIIVSLPLLVNIFTCFMHMTLYIVKAIATLGTIVSCVYGTNISSMHIWYSNSLHNKYLVHM
jgi:hypothetical protein